MDYPCTPLPSEETVDDGPQKKNARPSCSVDGCNNNAAGGGICIKHGGKRIKKKCGVEGCNKQVNVLQNNGVCYRHGAIFASCRVGGCYNQGKKGGVCKKHESMANHLPQDQEKNYRPRCSVDGCKNQGARGGICTKHGGKYIRRKCSVEGCTKHATNGGRTCISHGGIKRRTCSVEGCANQARNGGVCILHGAIAAKRATCKRRGCSTDARKGGFCWRHRPKEPCLVEGCDNIAIARGCCRKHANSNIHSKESNNSTTNDVDSDHQPQNDEQEGPLVCLPAVKRVNKTSNLCVTQDQAVMDREDDTTYYESESKRTHSNENQVCKNQTTASSDYFESEEEEELGALIYKSSRTAKMIAESNLSKTK